MTGLALSPSLSWSSSSFVYICQTSVVGIIFVSPSPPPAAAAGALSSNANVRMSTVSLRYLAANRRRTSNHQQSQPSMWKAFSALHQMSVRHLSAKLKDFRMADHHSGVISRLTSTTMHVQSVSSWVYFSNAQGDVSACT